MIVGSKSYVRPLIKVKLWDSLLTFPSVIQWCIIDKEKNISFHIPGCIVFLLFLKAGSPFYPRLDVKSIQDSLDESFECGWREEYQKLGARYSKPDTHSEVMKFFLKTLQS